MQVTNIYLARHGETEYNRLKQIQGRGIDASLNDTGRKQAQAIAQYLKDITFDQVVSSSLKRSIETAEFVTNQMPTDLVSYPDLDEMDFGVFEGRPIDEVKPDLKDLHERWKGGDISYSCDGGESPREVFDRANNRTQHILNGNVSNVLFVLHGRLLRILLSEWLGHGLSQMHKIPHSNGALYSLQWNDSGFKSLYLNKTDHLLTDNIK